MNTPHSSTHDLSNQTQKIFRHDFKNESPDPRPLDKIKCPPPWRQFGTKAHPGGPAALRQMDAEQVRRGKAYQIDEKTAELIDAALILHRPMLVSGHAGTGKSSLAYAIAWQFGLGNVLRWPITSRSTLKEALYSYDAIARLQDAALRQHGAEENVDPHDIGRYITLGPLGTALLPNKSGPYRPRVLLIDEIDKSDIDLPNDLLHVFEEGYFEIPEIARSRAPTIKVQTSAKEEIEVQNNGLIKCDDFPIVILTTNGERDFSPAFRRRCIEITIKTPDKEKLERIIHSQFSNLTDPLPENISALLDIFDQRIRSPHFRLAIDQLLSKIHLAQSGVDLDNKEKRNHILEAIFCSLTESGNNPEKQP